MEKTTTKYVVERFVHSTDKWTGYSFEQYTQPEFTKQLKDNPSNIDAAEAVLLDLSHAQPRESFRVVLRTTIVRNEVGLTMGPRKPHTVDDLLKLAKDPPNHDGVRVFNGIHEVVKAVNLDPDNFGALSSKLVRYAIETMVSPKNEWILVHPESSGGKYANWDTHREWWNLALRSKIKIEDWGVGDDKYLWFERVEYGRNVKSVRYKSFAGAITEDQLDIGKVSKSELKIPKTKSM